MSEMIEPIITDETGLKIVDALLKLSEEIESNFTGDDVVFYDFDGSVVASYSAEDFLTRKAMPENPDHTDYQWRGIPAGLVAQGWTHTLEEAKEYVGKYGKLNVGQLYTTDDGSLRVMIHLDEARLAPIFSIGILGTARVDWGDGSEQTEMVGYNNWIQKTPPHNYSEPGDYIISVHTDGKVYIPSSAIASDGLICGDSTGRYKYCIVEAQIAGGDINITNQNTCCGWVSLEHIVFAKEVSLTVAENMFINCYSLRHVTLPFGTEYIGGNMFITCRSLRQIIIPNNVNRVGANAFRNCSALRSVTLQNAITAIPQSAFDSCNLLKSVSIPDGVTQIGNTAFGCCNALQNVVLPDDLSSIGTQAFYQCYQLEEIVIPSGVTAIPSNTFNMCYFLKSVSLPQTLLSIGESAFRNCMSLIHIQIPDSVTSIETAAFASCAQLADIVLPLGATSLGYDIFHSCSALTSAMLSDASALYGGIFYSGSVLAICDFSRSTSVPTLGGTNAFNGTPSDLRILVPAALYDEWIVATNWASLANRIIPV